LNKQGFLEHRKHLIVCLFNSRRLLFLCAILAHFNFFSQNFSIIGNGTGTNTSQTYPAPYGLYYFGAKHQFLITAAELTAAGVPVGANMSSVGFNVISDNGTGVHNGFQVIVYSTTNADPLQSGYNTTGQVSSSTSTNYNPSTGWNQHALSSFTWNGTTNLVIQTCFNNAAYTTNATTQWTNTLAGSSIKSRYFYQDASTVCTSASTTATSSTTRPNIRIGWTAPASASNDLVCNATPISCGQTLSGSTINSTLSGTGEGLNCGTSQTMPGVWYTIPGNGQIMTASLCATSWDSKISVFSGSSCSSITCIGGIDDNGPSCNSFSASYSWNSVSGVNYYILIHGYSSNSTFSLSFNCTGNAPANPTGISISETSGNNPNDGMICSGGTAQLSVSGSSGTTYWFSGSCGSSTSLSVGNGVTLNVSPTVTTTYYARNYSGGVWSTSCASFTITVNPSPSTPSNPTSNSPQCNSVTITRSGTPPTGTTWYWQGTTANGTSTTLGSGTTYTATTTGTYYIRARNTNGCWSTSSGFNSVTVSGSGSTPPNPTSNSPQCNSVTITRSGTPPANETWYWQGTNANGTSTTLGSGTTYTATTSGTYYIRSRNTSGCWSNSSGSTTVSIGGTPITPSNPTSNSPQCNSVTITRSGTPPAGVTWYWQGMNANGTSTSLGSGATYTATTSGTYYIRARNSSGCWSSSSGSVSISISAEPLSPANPTSNSPQCSSVTLSRSGTPPSGVTWYWQGTNPNGTSTTLGSGSTYTATTSGTYYIRAMNSSGCWSSSSGSINVTITGLPNNPQNPTSDSPQCTSVTLTRSGTPPAGVTWYWQGANPNGTSTTLGSGANYTVSSSGTYYIRAMNSIGCWSASSGSVVATVSGLPQAPATPVSNSPNCSSVNISWNGTPPSGTVWYWQGTNANGTSTTLGSGANYTATSTGTYYIRALTSNNCWSTLSTGLPVVVLSSSSATQNQVVCNSYIAPNGINYTNSGQYQAIISNSAGCDSIITINLTVNNSYSVQNTVLACQSYTWIDGNTYTEDNNTATYLLTSSAGCDSLITLDLDISLPSNDTTYIQSTALGSFELNGVIYSEDGIYYQTLPDQYGCDSTIALQLSFDQTHLEEFNDISLLVYPNPSRDGIFILSKDRTLIIKGLFDCSGKRMIYTIDGNLLDISILRDGIYFLEIESNTTKRLIRLIKTS